VANFKEYKMSTKLVKCIVLLAFSFTLVACGESEEEKKEEKAKQVAAEMGYGAKMPKPNPSGKF